jgi:hypothetical protein
VDIDAQAQELYLALKTVPGILATVAAKREALADQLLNGDSRLEITSFSVAGQSGAGRLSATRPEMLAILNKLHRNLTNGGTALLNRTIPTF